MTYQFRALAEQAEADGRITAEEILSLRQSGWGDGRIEPAEAEAIFVLNDHLAERTPEWVDFFVEALSEFIVAGGDPRGFVSDDQAEWLISRLDQSGQVETMAELELLAHLFDKAQSLPERLKGYALAQIEQIVLTGTGPTRDGGTMDAARASPAPNAACCAASSSRSIPTPPAAFRTPRPKCCSGSRTRPLAPTTRRNGRACSSRAWPTT
jgi:hypothetical protein